MPSLYVVLPTLLFVPLALAAARSGESSGGMPDRLLFATFAEEAGSLEHIQVMVESIRQFGGSLRDAPIRVYAPRALLAEEDEAVSRLATLGADCRASEAPEASLWLYFSRKVFASAQAEAEAEGEFSVLAWLDEDTVVLREPHEFLLSPGVSLGFRPVMHQLIGSTYSEPADAFWSRVYQILSVPEESVFPVVTPADNKTLRAYLNAGCLIARPERGILRRWAADYVRIYEDSTLQRACREDRLKRIFLHQVALAGSVLSFLPRREMVQLSDSVNFPLFFKEMFGAEREFDSIEGVVTLRHEAYFRNPHPEWEKKLKGPADRVAWLKEHLARR